MQFWFSACFIVEMPIDLFFRHFLMTIAFTLFFKLNKMIKFANYYNTI